MTRTAIKFGAFVVVCTMFTLALASTIGNTSLLGLLGRGESTYEVKAAFDDISGLLVDDNVKIAGVPVGKVTSIDVEDGRAVVTMAIQRDRRVPADTAASIRWRNLIGQRYVYLEPGDAPTVLQDGAEITETGNVIDIGELFNRLGPIVATIDEGKVNEFLDAVSTAIEGNELALSRTLDDLASVVKGIGERDASISRLIDNLEIVARTIADRDAQIETMLDNLATLARTFSDNTELLDEALVEMAAFNRDLSFLLSNNAGEIDGLIAALDRTLGTVEGRFAPLEVTLDLLDDNAAATFRSSRNGEFLNQAILCLTTSPPPCPAPIVPGAARTSSQHPTRVEGTAAIVSLVRGDL